jgi:hypothetical protein
MKLQPWPQLAWIGVASATWATAVAACSAQPANAVVAGRPDGGSVEASAVETGAADGSDAGDGLACRCAVTQICVAGECRDKGTIATPTPPACVNPPCMNVYNNCPITLWTHAVGSVPIDDGNVRELEPRTQYQYSGLPTFGGGRLYAYYQQPNALQSTTPVSFYNQYVEVSIDEDAKGVSWQNYDISYVDSVSLPVSVQAENGCEATRCGSRFADWIAKLEECPTTLSYPANGVVTCMGSYNYCITHSGTSTNDDTQPYCTKMHVAHGYEGSEVYGGVFPGEPAQNVPFWDGVSAWNRGTTGGDTNTADYYVTEPYNDYAKMIHMDMGCRATATLQGVYAFSTDDHQNQAGFVRCASPVLDVVWCPYE